MPQLWLLVAVETAVIGAHALVERLASPAPFADRLRRVGQLHSLAYAAASLLGLLWWLRLAVVETPLRLCAPLDHHQLFFAAYFYSKLWEGLFDLSLVSMRGIPVSLHFRVHHYTTPVFAWIGWRTRATHAFLFAALNLFMHVFVYLWHGGVQPDLFKHLLRFWQHVQLLGGIALCLLSYAVCPSATYHDLIPAILFATYYILFQLELRDEALKQS